MKKENGIKYQLRELADELHKTIDKRMIEIEREYEPKGFTGDAVCYESNASDWWTNGQIYHFENGITRNNNGVEYGFSEVRTCDDWNKRFCTCRFRPAVESDYPAPAVRLWCAHDEDMGWGAQLYRRGDVLTFENKKMFFPRVNSTGCTFESLNDYRIANPETSKYLFPLAKRPAKEGEWVKFDGWDKKGVVGCVLKVDERGYPYVLHPSVWGFSLDSNGMEKTYITNGYEVIDGYHGEYEQPEELLQGAVVCYASCDEKTMKLFKKYVAKDGVITYEDGAKSRPYKSVDDFNTDFLGFKIARLIEDEGEK